MLGPILWDFWTHWFPERSPYFFGPRNFSPGRFYSEQFFLLWFGLWSALFFSPNWGNLTEPLLAYLGHLLFFGNPLIFFLGRFKGGFTPAYQSTRSFRSPRCPPFFSGASYVSPFFCCAQQCCPNSLFGATTFFGFFTLPPLCFSPSHISPIFFFFSQPPKIPHVFFLGTYIRYLPFFFPSSFSLGGNNITLLFPSKNILSLFLERSLTILPLL